MQSLTQIDVGNGLGFLKVRCSTFHRMRVLFVETHCHRKNSIGFDLLCKANSIDAIRTDDSSVFDQPFDLVIVPSQYIPPHAFPNAKYIMYGPHNFVFTNGVWQGKGNSYMFQPHCFYNLLSQWIIELQEEDFGGMSLVSKAVPFPVDIDRFCPSLQEAKYDCFVYFKGRKQELLSFAESRLKGLGLRYTVLQYGSYTEEHYLDVLRTSRFGIWIGSHESQGFALEEALSTNVPLVVWNVKSMFDEYNRQNEISYKEDERIYKLKATTVPYWDARCGELFTQKEEFDAKVLQMSQTYTNYKPRDYIVETLSPKACYERLLATLSTLPQNPQTPAGTAAQAPLSQ